jgi:hypothetical protein
MKNRLLNDLLSDLTENDNGNYNPRIATAIVLNHWRPCRAPTLPLGTPFDSLDLPEKIIIN